MKCKLADVLNAAKAVKKMMDIHYNNFQVMYNLVKLSKSMDENITFFTNEYNKINEEQKKNGGKGYGDKVTDLTNTEVSIDISEPVVISQKDIADSKDYPTPLEILSLEKFIKFVM